MPMTKLTYAISLNIAHQGASNISVSFHQINISHQQY